MITIKTLQKIFRKKEKSARLGEQRLTKNKRGRGEIRFHPIFPQNSKAIA